jgi:hypothetical protein
MPPGVTPPPTDQSAATARSDRSSRARLMIPAIGARPPPPARRHPLRRRPSSTLVPKKTHKGTLVIELHEQGRTEPERKR